MVREIQEVQEVREVREIQEDPVAPEGLVGATRRRSENFAEGR